MSEPDADRTKWLVALVFLAAAMAFALLWILIDSNTFSTGRGALLEFHGACAWLLR